MTLFLLSAHTRTCVHVCIWCAYVCVCMWTKRYRWMGICRSNGDEGMCPITNHFHSLLETLQFLFCTFSVSLLISHLITFFLKLFINSCEINASSLSLIWHTYTHTHAHTTVPYKQKSNWLERGTREKERERERGRMDCFDTFRYYCSLKHLSSSVSHVKRTYIDVWISVIHMCYA